MECIDNHLLYTIKTRRSIRKYTDEPLPENALRHILLAGMYSPSKPQPSSVGIHPGERSGYVEENVRLQGRLRKNAGARESCYRSHRQSKSLGCLDRGLLRCYVRNAPDG